MLSFNEREKKNDFLLLLLFQWTRKIANAFIAEMHMNEMLKYSFFVFFFSLTVSRSLSISLFRHFTAFFGQNEMFFFFIFYLFWSMRVKFQIVVHTYYVTVCYQKKKSHCKRWKMRTETDLIRIINFYLPIQNSVTI